MRTLLCVMFRSIQWFCKRTMNVLIRLRIFSIKPFCKRTAKTLIRLRKCAVWSGPSLPAYDPDTLYLTTLLGCTRCWMSSLFKYCMHVKMMRSFSTGTLCHLRTTEALTSAYPDQGLLYNVHCTIIPATTANTNLEQFDRWRADSKWNLYLDKSTELES